MTNYLLIIAAVVGMVIGAGGTIMITKATQPEIPPCPTCPECPPATEVKLQDFDLGKLNNKKGNFTYAPQLNNVTVRIEAKDSVLFKRMLREAK